MKLKQYLLTEKIGITTKKDRTGHIHAAMVNADGDGKTVDTKGTKDHEHMIYQWLIQPSHGHVHDISED
jgi:hypothetical protein